MSDRRVLVAGTDAMLRGEACRALSGLRTVEATDTVTTSALGISCRPDLIVIDARDAWATDAITMLRRDFRTSLTPFVYVVDHAPASGPPIAAADDYVIPPLGAELADRVEFCLRRAAAARGISPLTGLPGNTAVAEQMTRWLDEGDEFACLYIDLDDFKTFNDRHGFVQGDDLIRSVGDCILHALDQQPPGACFAGHLGGDDFVVLTPAVAAASAATAIIECFDDSTCSMSIGIVKGRPELREAATLAAEAAAMKAIAKRRAGSAWAPR